MLELIECTNPILHKKTDPVIVGDILPIEEMYKLMINKKGIGLAAPQVGISKSFFIIKYDNSYLVIINPKILNKSNTKIALREGCLSFPNKQVIRFRSDRVLTEFYNSNNKKIIKEFSGIYARVFQHEFDHLQGKTI